MNLEKFTDRAKGFLQSAQTVAIRMSHQRISPEHLLKALLEDEQGMASGLIAELKRTVGRQFEVRVKGDRDRFAARLAEAGVAAAAKDEALVVVLAEGQSTRMLWRVAGDAGEQIRLLRPKQSSLEEVFLDALAIDGA